MSISLSQIEMDVDIRNIQTQELDTPPVQKLLHHLSEIVSEAAELRDIEAVRNPALRQALNIVEDFLRKSKRICYGGMAINAHLPASKKFYDFSKTLPDYDFFTPDPEGDVKRLMAIFKKEKFDSVEARIGMHKGTHKIFVNFHAVADITYIPEWLQRRLLDRSITDKGISYVDADFLRMNMYLELSRPRGEVERWDKVQKRLLLLNEASPPKFDHCGRKAVAKVPAEIHDMILRQGAQHHLIFAGADLEEVQAHPRGRSTTFLLGGRSPLLFQAEAPKVVCQKLLRDLKQEQPKYSLGLTHWPSYGELVPEMFGVTRNGKPIAVFVQINQCHAQNTIVLDNGETLAIASLDTMITLFQSLSFVKGMEGIVPESAHCFASRLVKISQKTRDQGKISHQPLFSVTCMGHQPTKETLLREKAERIAAEKKRLTRRNRR